MKGFDLFPDKKSKKGNKRDIDCHTGVQRRNFIKYQIEKRSMELGTPLLINFKSGANATIVLTNQERKKMNVSFKRDKSNVDRSPGYTMTVTAQDGKGVNIGSLDIQVRFIIDSNPAPSHFYLKGFKKDILKSLSFVEDHYFLVFVCKTERQEKGLVFGKYCLIPISAFRGSEIGKKGFGLFQEKESKWKCTSGNRINLTRFEKSTSPIFKPIKDWKPLVNEIFGIIEGVK